jgi:hypothetical protein
VRSLDLRKPAARVGVLSLGPTFIGNDDTRNSSSFFLILAGVEHALVFSRSFSRPPVLFSTPNFQSDQGSLTMLVPWMERDELQLPAKRQGAFQLARQPAVNKLIFLEQDP